MVQYWQMAMLLGLKGHPRFYTNHAMPLRAYSSIVVGGYGEYVQLLRLYKNIIPPASSRQANSYGTKRIGTGFAADAPTT